MANHKKKSYVDNGYQMPIIFFNRNTCLQYLLFQLIHAYKRWLLARLIPSSNAIDISFYFAENHY